MTDLARTPDVMSAHRRCAANNVDWYEAVLEPHRISGSIEHGMWICRESVPPYYSNVVTLAPAPLDAQVAMIRGLAGAFPGPFTVKDSFARLDLAPLGFDVLFRATWIWRDPASPLPDDVGEDIVWRSVTSPSALDRWEAAWREHGSPASTRVFLPDLLANPAVELVAGVRDERVVAGYASNRSIDVVGVTNLFTASEVTLQLAAALRGVARFAPGLPVVGFASGRTLGLARRLGFRSVGRLRVWISREDAVDNGAGGPAG